MKNTYLALTIVLLSLASFTSCKKKGCTDPLAINYFSKVTTDDGSCSYSTTRMIGNYGYIYETFDAQAVIYSRSISEMRMDGLFDENFKHFDFIVDWPTKAIMVPDTLLPDGMTCRGLITDKDNLSCTLTVNRQAPANDTVYYYAFKRR